MTTHNTGADGRLAGVPRLKTRPRPAIYGSAWSIGLFVADLGVVVGAALGAQALTETPLARLLARDVTVAPLVFGTVLWLLLFSRIGMYRRSFSANARDEVYACLAASAMAMLPTLVLFLVVPSLIHYRHFVLAAALFVAFGVTLVRYLAQMLRLHVFPVHVRRIAVVGSPDRVAAVPGELSLTNSDDVLRLPIDGFDDQVAQAVAAGDVLGLDWLQTAVTRGYREIIITEALPPDIMPALLRFTEAQGIRVAFAPMRIRPHACDFKVRRDGGLALLYPQSLAICTPGAELLRRVVDLAIAVPAVMLLSPLLAGLALALALGDGRPILYRQTRVGRFGKPFTILKFRTMHVNAESATGPVWARTGEPRTTRIGKWLRRSSLDELPQLFNVIRGDMSIVGPRPERPYYVEQFRRMLPRYDERHLVRPGITGWSHIHMRRNIETSEIGERLGYDLFYLEHWSIFMDVLIIAKTGAEFLFHSAV